jgi:hypothetical protein
LNGRELRLRDPQCKYSHEGEQRAVVPELATAGLAALFVAEFLAALAYAAWLAGFPLFHLV